MSIVRTKSARKSRAKTVPLSSLVRKLDTVLSKFVRMSHADEGGTAQCITCGKLDHWKDLDCGHYVKRQHMSTRFLEPYNLAPQCKRCNRFAGGVMDEYAAYIVRTHGMKVFEDLMQLKHTTRKWTREELKDLIVKYESLVREQEARILPV